MLYTYITMRLDLKIGNELSNVIEKLIRNLTPTKFAEASNTETNISAYIFVVMIKVGRRTYLLQHLSSYMYFDH